MSALLRLDPVAAHQQRIQLLCVRYHMLSQTLQVLGSTLVNFASIRSCCCTPAKDSAALHKLPYAESDLAGAGTHTGIDWGWSWG